jgi:hypothetical protein
VSQRRKENGQDDAEREHEQRCRAANGLHETQRCEQQRVASAQATCVYRKLDSAILVVKATENWV